MTTFHQSPEGVTSTAADVEMNARAHLFSLINNHTMCMWRLNPARLPISKSHWAGEFGFVNPHTEENRRQRTELLHQVLAALDDIEPESLDSDARHMMRTFQEMRVSELELLQFPEHMMPIFQSDGVAVDFVFSGTGESCLPFELEEDYTHWLERCRSFPSWVDTAIQCMREGVSKGITQAQCTIECTLGVLKPFTVNKGREHPFWGPIDNLPQHLAAKREELEKEFGAAINTIVVPALTKLVSFLEVEYLPKRRAELPGLCGIPGGVKWYRALVRYHTTTTMGPEELYQLGLIEMQRIHSEMHAVQQVAGIPGTLRNLFDYLQNDPAAKYTTGEEAIEAYRALQGRVQQNFGRLFNNPPKQELEIKPTEESRAEGAPCAEYQEPRPASHGRPAKPGVFYVNTFLGNAKADTESLYLHEAVPGHHYQICIAHDEDIPMQFQADEPSAYIEGWALYCETLGHELGLYTDPLQHLGQLNAALLRAIRLVVDVGLHVKGWSKQQAIDYISSNCGLLPEETVSEVDRYITYPAQALAYTTGLLAIQSLRREAEEALGDDFDVRHFHDVILSHGALTLNALRDKVESWVEGQAEGTARLDDDLIY